MVLATDSWPKETTWSIATDDGSIVASGGTYSLIYVDHEEKTCVPSNARNCTLFDQDDGGPTVDITRLGKTCEIKGTFTVEVSVDICPSLLFNFKSTVNYSR